MPATKGLGLLIFYEPTKLMFREELKMVLQGDTSKVGNDESHQRCTPRQPGFSLGDRWIRVCEVL
jgi:hypothetical protein